MVLCILILTFAFGKETFRIRDILFTSDDDKDNATQAVNISNVQSHYFNHSNVISVNVSSFVRVNDLNDAAKEEKGMSGNNDVYSECVKKCKLYGVPGAAVSGCQCKILHRDECDFILWEEVEVEFFYELCVSFCCSL